MTPMVRATGYVVTLATVFVVLGTRMASAGTITLLATQDTGIAKNDTGDVSWGKYLIMAADITLGADPEDRRLLVKWDLSSIPAGSTITSAQVNIYLNNSNDATDGLPFSAYKLTSDWTEGHGMRGGGYPAGYGPDGANWTYNKLESLTPWVTPGGDFDVNSRVQFIGATVYDPTNDAYFGMQPVITGIAQSWYVGPNFGLLIKSDESLYERHFMRTRDYGYPNDGQDRPSPGVFAPQLIISYAEGGGPSSQYVPAGTGTIINIGSGPGGVGGTMPTVLTPGYFTSTYLTPLDATELAGIIGSGAAGTINFVLPGEKIQLWDLAFSGTFTGEATVTLHYDPSLLGPNVLLSDLLVVHYHNGSWSFPSGQVVDSINHTITFTTDSFSPFILSGLDAEPSAVPEPSTFVLAGLGLVGLGFLALRRKYRQA